MVAYDLRGRPRSTHNPLIATSITSNAPAVVEFLASSPYHALLLDMEHTTLSAADVELLIRVADITGKPVLVRVPEIGTDIPRVLDAGAAGIIVPQVETPEQARAVVDRARYAPAGRRGLGATRGSAYGNALASPTFQDDTNARLLVAIQIESAAGVEAADAILATPGIDAVVIGPGDLSASLGVAIGAPEYWAAVEAVFAAAAAHGVTAGAFVFRLEDLAPLHMRGAGFLLVGSDFGWIVQGAASDWAAIEHHTHGKGTD